MFQSSFNLSPLQNISLDPQFLQMSCTMLERGREGGRRERERERVESVEARVVDCGQHVL